MNFPTFWYDETLIRIVQYVIAFAANCQILMVFSVTGFLHQAQEQNDGYMKGDINVIICVCFARP